MKLEDAVALVTGGSRGIGLAVARALAARGTRVALVARSRDPLERAAREIAEEGGHVLALPADVTDPHAVRAVVERVESELGPLEILVANAGSLSAVGRTWEVPVEAWKRDVEINLFGVHLCCREALRGMVARRRGYVFIVSSSAGTRKPHVHGSAYGVSKLALTGYAETLAREADGVGVRVFAIDPGSVRTAMTEPLLADAALRGWLPGFQRSVERGNDLPPSAAAELVLEVLSGQADRLTGRFLSASEGLARIRAAEERILAEDLYTVRLRTP